jgi:peptidoglycan-N-acetylglucosamine deacetylase
VITGSPSLPQRVLMLAVLPVLAVALTFDDGLNGRYTAEAAAILERYGVRGTFFVVARTLEEQPELAHDLRRRGHLLANHTYDHPHTRRTDLRFGQLAHAQRAFHESFGDCPSFFRPPWGIETPFQKRAVRHARMRTVLWDVEAGDWRERDPAVLAKHILEKARPGSIILLHDGTEGIADADHSVMLAALPTIVEGLIARGLMPTRLDALLGMPATTSRCEPRGLAAIYPRHS